MCTAPQKNYLLDTNSFFYLIQTELDRSKVRFQPNASILKAGKLYISTITRVEVFSALGKTIRGKSESSQPCSRMTVIQDSEGSRQIVPCSNVFYQPKEPRWSNRRVAAYRAAIKQILDNKSRDIQVSTLSFDSNTISCAEGIIIHALQHNFASMDAMIAATAKQAANNGLTNIQLVTSDKALQRCLDIEHILYWDAFQGWGR